MLDLINCYECGQLAEVLDRYQLDTTSGPLAHLKTRCVQGHNYNGPEKTNG